jgi:hypothetical protein
MIEDPPFSPEILALAQKALQDRFGAAGAVPGEDSFDAYKATAAEIERYLLPPRQAISASPELDDFYRRMMQPPLTYVIPKPTVLTTAMRLTVRGSHTGGIGGPRGMFGGRWGTTRNWCGAVVAAHGGLRFQSVAARWIVPTPSKPSKGFKSRTPPPGKSWRTSVWVGLDGFRRFQPSLPQAGTVSTVDFDEATNTATAPRAYFFAQWWVRGKPFGEIPIPEIVVRPGDEIYVLMVRRSPTNVSFHVTNRTTNVTTHLAWTAGTYDWAEAGVSAIMAVPEAPTIDAPSEGLYAVYCAERPGIMPADTSVINDRYVPDPFNMPDFSPIGFGEAMAVMSDPNNPNAAGLTRDLTAARWFRVTSAGRDAAGNRTQVLASPGAPARAPGNFTVTQAEVA